MNAGDGSLLWRIAWPKGQTAVIPTPIVDGNQIYVTSGYNAGSAMFEVSAANETKEIWANSVMENHHGGVVKIGDYVYGFSSGEGLICQEFKSGDLVWSERGRRS